MADHIDDGGSAFPSEQGHDPGVGWNQTFDRGMSLRDYFAAKALTSYMASLGGTGAWDDRHFCRAAVFCYQIADAMLAEREKGARSDG